MDKHPVYSSAVFFVRKAVFVRNLQIFSKIFSFGQDYSDGQRNISYEDLTGKGCGDLSMSLQADSQDEIGAVAGAFYDMSAQLNDLLRKISVASQQVASSSRNTTSQQLSAQAELLQESVKGFRLRS